MNKERAPLTTEQKTSLVERFSEPETNYNLLREGVQHFQNKEGAPDTAGILQRYVKCTDKLIGVADGSIDYRDIYDERDDKNKEKSKEAPDEIIFLDKSARPVSWFIDAFWEQFACEGAVKPHYDFLNIDRVEWFMDQGFTQYVAERDLGPNDFDIKKVDQEEIDRIRAIFSVGELTADGWKDEVRKLPTVLDGKKILIVDEVRNKGGTLAIAVQLLQAAIPEAVVSGIYFWEQTGSTMVGDQLQIDSSPVWYSATDPYGRDIGEPSTAYFDHMYQIEPSQENLRRKLGRRVLSAPHHDEITFELKDDVAAKRLKQDIAYLTYAVASGLVPRRPSSYRSEDNFDQILEKQGLTRNESAEWYEKSREIKKQGSR